MRSVFELSCHNDSFYPHWPAAQGDAIKAPLWDVAAQGPTAYPNNAAFVQQ